MELIELIEQPAFIVSDGKVTKLNRAAQLRQFSANQDIEPLLGAKFADYQAFTDGALCLRLCIDGTFYDATIQRTESGDVFLLDDVFANHQLRAMALCAQQLRTQLSGVMSSVERQSDSDLTRGVYRLQRTVCNMSDIAYYNSSTVSRESVEIGSLMAEITEKAAALLEASGHKLFFTGLREQVFTQCNTELLERAVYNILSNAVKFSEAGKPISATLVKRGSCVLLTIEDSGEGISSDLYGTLFVRYQRQPGIEDVRHGIGLGMALVKTAAAIHGGTVLITKGSTGGTKVTLSLAICPPEEDVVRTPTMKLSDYAGGIDHALMELADVLPSKLYD